MGDWSGSWSPSGPQGWVEAPPVGKADKATDTASYLGSTEVPGLMDQFAGDFMRLEAKVGPALGPTNPAWKGMRESVVCPALAQSSALQQLSEGHRCR